MGASNFDMPNDVAGWSVSGNFADVDSDSAGGLKHQMIMFGALRHYIYGVDEVQQLDLKTGLEQRKWYFEASPAIFHRPELVMAYGGRLRFTVRALYGNFNVLNSPLDWVVLECASCNSGRGIRLVRFVDELLSWAGEERTVEVPLKPYGLWKRDPQSTTVDFEFATDCEIIAVLRSLSRLAILVDFARGGEGVAID